MAAEVAVVLHATGPAGEAVAPGRKMDHREPRGARGRRASQAHAAGILTGVRCAGCPHGDRRTRNLARQAQPGTVENLSGNRRSTKTDWKSWPGTYS